MVSKVILSKRKLLSSILLAVGARLILPRRIYGQTVGAVTRADVARLLDTKDPQIHCSEKHDHGDDSFDDWKGSLEWSLTDCGHNEGAAPIIKVAVDNGLSYPELMQGCPDTESAIPRVAQALKDPSTLDDALKLIPPDKAVLLKQALKEHKSFTEILVMTAAIGDNDAVGEVWRRKAMMRFAKALAVKGKLAPATAVATASQWHNCHAFRCLLRHPGEVADWLRIS